jgi:(S)-3,5-dihydroxyphenylglycine transaminase
MNDITAVSSHEDVPISISTTVKITPEDVKSGPLLQSMDFLNCASSLFPNAISLAAGRPPNACLGTSGVGRWLSRYVEVQDDTVAAWASVGQYAPTAGVIKPYILQMLRVTEDVEIDESRIFVTNGFQEALLVELYALAAQNGAVICLDPTYVGLAGAAMLAGVPLYVSEAIDPAQGLQQAAAKAKADGYANLIAYLIPDHSNPQGLTLSLEQRMAVLRVANQTHIRILEDTAYRIFRYSGEYLPSLFKLDVDDIVTYIGTFSKMFMPGIRVGFSITPREDASARFKTEAKSFISVTTAPICQAIAAGFILEWDGDLRRANKDRIDYCATNRNVMLRVLDRNFSGVVGVSYSRPEGGFFIVVTLPFEFGTKELQFVASEFGVIVVPMQYFSVLGLKRNQVRLAFSGAVQDEIELATECFCRFVLTQLNETQR